MKVCECGVPLDHPGCWKAGQAKGGSELTVGVSPHQVQDGEEVGRALDTGDQVELSVVINRKLGTTVAEAVKLLCKAEDKRELGQVSFRRDHLPHVH